MESRISYKEAAPGAFDALLRLSGYVSKCGLEESLVDLVCLRASQINGCAYCIEDEVYQVARKQFSEADLANLTLAIAVINSWNRMNIAFRTPAGKYQAPAKVRKAG